MGLPAAERLMLRRIEEALRRDDPGLDAFLAGGRPPGRTPGRTPGRRASRARAVWVLAGYLVPPVVVLAGLVLHAAWLVAAGAAACPCIPVLAWLLIRRRPARGRAGHAGGP
jgi:Protein of unknown function (DUF3040)